MQSCRGVIAAQATWLGLNELLAAIRGVALRRPAVRDGTIECLAGLRPCAVVKEIDAYCGANWKEEQEKQHPQPARPSFNIIHIMRSDWLSRLVRFFRDFMELLTQTGGLRDYSPTLLAR
jgi:hypothetical protein